jgi:hypothetical protein
MWDGDGKATVALNVWDLPLVLIGLPQELGTNNRIVMTCRPHGEDTKAYWLCSKLLLPGDFVSFTNPWLGYGQVANFVKPHDTMTVKVLAHA